MEEKYWLVRDFETGSSLKGLLPELVFSELYQCQRENDIDGIHRIVEALTHWCEKTYPSDGPGRARDTALGTIDLLCCATDFYLELLVKNGTGFAPAKAGQQAWDTVVKAEGLTTYQPQDALLGDVRRFFRHALDYHKPLQKLN